MLEPGETCDDDNTANGDGCNSVCLLEICGNGVLDGSEVCDDGNTVSADGCSADCKSNETCGNGIVDVPAGETCDDDNSANGDGCNSVCLLEICGNGVLDGSEVCDDGNTISNDGCAADCQSDESCGNSVVDVAAGETCDDGASNSEDPDATCRTNCQVRRCGDGILDNASGEQCDAAQMGASTCADFGYYSGSPGCTGTCQYDISSCSGTCGDGVADSANGEACDGLDLDNRSCATEGFCSGSLACLGNCQLNQFGCSGSCGDGAKNGSEACDGSDFGGQGCTDFGFHTGTLACNGTCDVVDTASCSGFCGDGVQNGPEVCDDADLGLLTCGTFGYYSGTPGCNTTCDGADTGTCEGVCGDGTRNGPEVCDGTDLGGLSCQSYGFTGGTLACDSACNGVDNTACVDYCGDGIRNGNEQCDGLDQGGLTCRAFGAKAGRLGCNHYCQPTTDRCHWGAWRQQTVPADFNDVVSVASNDVWATTANGDVWHFDGVSWNTVFSAGSILQAIWSNGGVDMWVGGDSVWHSDGGGWIEHSIGNAYPVSSMWASGPNDVWAATRDAVGGDFALRELHHYDGSAWQLVTGVSGRPLDVWGLSESDVWVASVVVSWGNRFYKVNHYDGAVWTTYPSIDARAVGGTSPTDIWAVGASISHFDGTDWTDFPVPFGTGTLRTIWASASDDVWALGDNGAIVHYDGALWSQRPAPTGQTLLGISGSDAHEVWAVGVDSTAIHYDGPGWRPVFSLATDLFSGWGELWGTSASDMWATSGLSSGTTHFDGYSTSYYGVTHRGGWSASPTASWAVRASSDLNVNYWDGSTWAATSFPPGAYDDVWGTAANDVWVVGRLGAAFHWDGTSWSDSSPVTSEGLTAVWGRQPDDYWAVGGNGTVLHYTTSWVPSAVPTTASLSEVWGAGPSTMWANSPEDVWAMSYDPHTVYHLSHPYPTDYSGTCESPIGIYCEMSTHGATTANDPNRFQSYSCGARDDSGGEVIYKLENPVTGQVTVRVTPHDGDLDLMVIGDSGGACDASQCVAASQTSGMGYEEITFPATQGDTYYFVVDGYAGAQSAFSIDLTCDKQ